MPDPERNPWRRKSRRLAYENAWIQVHHDEVTRPDGAPGVYGVVHFRNLAIGIVAIDAADRVLLVGQHRYALGRYSWEIPEGGVPFGEGPLEGARRELREETGYRAAEWRQIVAFDLSNSVTDESGVIFLATGLLDGEPDPEGTEQLELRRVPFAEALAMIDRSEITDAMSLLGLERVARLRAMGGSRAPSDGDPPSG